MPEFQARVRANYAKLMDNSWFLVNTDDKCVEEVFNEVRTAINKAIANHTNLPITPLWPIQDV